MFKQKSECSGDCKGCKDNKDCDCAECSKDTPVVAIAKKKKRHVKSGKSQ